MSRLTDEAFVSLGRINGILEANVEGMTDSDTVIAVMNVMVDFGFVRDEEKALRISQQGNKQ